MHSFDSISLLYKMHFGVTPVAIESLSAAGSNRKYYLITAQEGRTPLHAVATYGCDTEENKAFISLSRHFKGKGLPVPAVFCESDDSQYYLQEYLGNTSLFDFIAGGRLNGQFSSEELDKVEECVRMLPHFQIEGADGLDFDKSCIVSAMNANMIANDLNYFKYCFLKSSGLEYSEKRLDFELGHLASIIEAVVDKADTFMVRDFQSRNIMLCNGKPYLIDFQGGRKGPLEYDLASFLWQAKAKFTDDIKRDMIAAYVDEAKVVDANFSVDKFCESLPYFVLFRILQTLGAYGFRGWSEHKPHFLQSLPAGVKGLVDFFDCTILPSFKDVSVRFPYLKELANRLHSSSRIVDIETVAGLLCFSGLTLMVSSFSYKRGVPYDLSGNGGGFVFDCRGIQNPGKYDEYKPLTGLDLPVIRFIEDNGEIYQFLLCCEALVEASVKRYLERGFTSLSVAFGCTGGCHRSVYSAQALGKYFAEKYPEVRVVVNHREQRKLFVFNDFKQSETRNATDVADI